MFYGKSETKFRKTLKFFVQLAIERAGRVRMGSSRLQNALLNFEAAMHSDCQRECNPHARAGRWHLGVWASSGGFLTFGTNRHPRLKIPSPGLKPFPFTIEQSLERAQALKIFRYQLKVINPEIEFGFEKSHKARRLQGLQV